MTKPKKELKKALHVQLSDFAKEEKAQKKKAEREKRETAREITRKSRIKLAQIHLPETTEAKREDLPEIPKKIPKRSLVDLDNRLAECLVQFPGQKIKFNSDDAKLDFIAAHPLKKKHAD